MPQKPQKKGTNGPLLLLSVTLMNLLATSIFIETPALGILRKSWPTEAASWLFTWDYCEQIQLALREWCKLMIRAIWLHEKSSHPISYNMKLCMYFKHEVLLKRGMSIQG